MSWLRRKAFIDVRTDGKVFNNAAQHWNHSFYWHCLSPQTTEPSGDLKNAIVNKWGSVENFNKEFNTQAAGNFGSGWTWLAEKGGEISIVNTSNAGNPMTSGYNPLLTVDIWEHAYYIDYRNARAKYLDTFSKLINWKFVNDNFQAKKATMKL